jgi:hypothetical protein
MAERCARKRTGQVTAIELDPDLEDGLEDKEQDEYTPEGSLASQKKAKPNPRGTPAYMHTLRCVK